MPSTLVGVLSYVCRKLKRLILIMLSLNLVVHAVMTNLLLFPPAEPLVALLRSRIVPFFTQVVHFRSTQSAYHWTFVNVYGPCQGDQRVAFIQ